MEIQILLQNSGGTEARAVRMASMLHDGIKVTNTDLDTLNRHREALQGGAIPVGSVEFVRHGMRLAGIAEPQSLSYPQGCEPYMHRSFWQSTAEMALAMNGRRFIKPCATKQFTGFVLESGPGADALQALDQFELDELLRCAPETPVWISEPVTWVSEFRYYVMGSEILGYARYDQLEAESVPEPNLDVVRQCIADLNIAHPYALDFGVLDTGQTALVEGNDAWAIGFYGGGLQAYDYVRFLAERWRTLKRSESPPLMGDFEAWYCREYWNFKATRPQLWDGSRYQHPSVEFAWLAWQSASDCKSDAGRLAFETWCKRQAWPERQPPWSFRWDGNRYPDLVVELAWQSWSAAKNVALVSA